MTDTTPTPDPLARFRELAWSLLDEWDTDCGYRISNRADIVALLAEAERLVEVSHMYLMALSRIAEAAGVEDREAGPDVVFEAVVQDRAALLAIASYGDKLTGQERTLHHDLIDIARRALRPAPEGRSE